MGNTAGCGTYGYFSLHSSLLHVLHWKPRGRLKELQLFIFILKHQRRFLSCCLYYIISIVKLHYSRPWAQRPTHTHTHTHTHTLAHTQSKWDACAKRCSLWFGLVKLLTLKRENYLCWEAGSALVCVCVSVCVSAIYECLVVMGAGGGGALALS